MCVCVHALVCVCMCRKRLIARKWLAPGGGWQGTSGTCRASRQEGWAGSVRQELQPRASFLLTFPPGLLTVGLLSACSFRWFATLWAACPSNKPGSGVLPGASTSFMPSVAGPRQKHELSSLSRKYPPRSYVPGSELEAASCGHTRAHGAAVPLFP